MLCLRCSGESRQLHPQRLSSNVHIHGLPQKPRRREVEAAQAGAAAERAARAAAEAALAEARALLQDADARLKESLANGPKAALAALLEEKEAAEAAAAAAIEEAAAETRALKEKRRKELLLLTVERDEVTGRMHCMSWVGVAASTGWEPTAAPFEISAIF